MGVCGSLENLRRIFLVSRTLGRVMQRILRPHFFVIKFSIDDEEMGTVNIP